MIEDLWAETLSQAMSGKASTRPLPDAFPSTPRKAEDELLYRVAAVGIHALAGSTAPSRNFKSIEEASDDGCPLAAAALLSSLLRESADFPLVRQWVVEAVRHGYGVPYESAARVHKAFDAKDVPIPPGALDSWFAFRKIETPDPAVEFETTSGADRLAALRRWRAIDPVAAREAVAATLRQETANARAALVSCLSIGAGIEDEPFLVEVLADRAGDVRAAATAVLVEIPTSGVAMECAARAREHLRLAGGKLDVKLPGATGRLGSKWLADKGINNLRDMPTRICELTAAAPLSAWDDAKPSDWIAAAEASDWTMELRAGWAIAAHREGSSEWALALGPSLIGDAHEGSASTIAMYVLDILRGEEWEATVSDILWVCDLKGALSVLSTFRGTAWSPEFTKSIADRLPKMVESHAGQRWYERVSLSPVGLVADPMLADAFSAIADGWGSDNMEWARGEIRTVADLMTRRRAIAASFLDR